jgi:ectoine hydroxylase-related dioxygenase (phytanoyl-CoA dioxygenase family)
VDSEENDNDDGHRSPAMVSPNPMITSADVDRFVREGFLVVHDVFSAGEMAAFRDAVDAALNRRGDQPVPMAERSAYDRMFTQYFNLWEDSPEVRRLTFEPRLAAIVSALLDSPVLRVYCDQSFYKDPGSSDTGAHQDYTLLSIKETRTLTVWIPLEGCTRESGALGYVPGSHRFEPVTKVDLLLGRDPFDNPELQTMLADPVVEELPAGSVAFHHVLTYHLSTPNQSNRTRKAFAITYVADGSTRGTTWPHASVDRAGIAVGERIEGPATPVVWPTPAHLPAPPPPNPNPPRGWPGYKPRPD